MKGTGRQDGKTAGAVVRWIVLLGALAPWRLAAQDVPPPPERYRPTAAFPAAVGLMLSSGSYGDRAKLPRPATGDEITYKLSSGLAIGGHVQFPVTRRLGLVGSASITRRNRRAERQGDPFSSNVDKVAFNRFEAGLGFRFRPHAPVFFAGTFVYHLISPGPVEFQDVNVAEVGGGVGVGYDFSVSRSPVFGRIEVWNYWVKPSGTDLDPGYEAKRLTHDLSVALSVNYRLTLSRARVGSGR